MIIQPLRQLVQLSGGGTQGIRAILPNVRHYLIVDVLHNVLQVRLQMRRSVLQLLFPRSF